MAEPIGIGGTMDAMNNLNVKTVIDLILTNAVANQKAQQDESNANTQAINTIRHSSLGQIVNRMNSLDTSEAAAIARVTRTPTGDAKTDIAGAVALAQQLMKGAQTTPPVTAP